MKEREKKMNWISVKERLPKVNKDVLLFSPFYLDYKYFIGKLLKDGAFVCEEAERDIFFGKEKVTHWMPLPEPPEVEE